MFGGGNTWGSGGSLGLGNGESINIELGTGDSYSTGGTRSTRGGIYSRALQVVVFNM